MIVNIGVMQQHFRRNASHVQARSAQERILLHDHGFQTELARAYRRHIATRSAADYCDVVLSHAHSPI